MATLLQRRLHARKRGIGMPGDNNHILAIARSLLASVDAAIIGGIAVHLHGGLRTTDDLDLYTTDRRLTANQLVASGARWNAAQGEHVLDGVRIHAVTPEEAGYVVERVSVIDGARVVSLKDLIAIKLLCGLSKPGRAKDIAHVEDLIAVVPLDKRFAARLPKEIRDAFKALVDGVRANQRARSGKPRF